MGGWICLDTCLNNTLKCINNADFEYVKYIL